MPTFENSEFADYQQPRSLATAIIDWQATTPFARNFTDVYFSRDQGPAESQYVFLQQNNLEKRWKNWTEPRAFVVGETGFGTGLNLLVAMDSFLKAAPENARLHWITTELYPLTPEDLERAHAFWPEFKAFAQLLQQNYPLAISGFHRLNLHPRITVDLLLGDAASNLSGLAGKADAWCLDGFAPSKNPSMWTEQLFTAIANASHPGTTFATFTAAGIVKRGLQNVGFTVNKVAGFGRKREMLNGTFNSSTPKQRRASYQSSSTTLSTDKPIAIIGAGLAGLFTAQALTKRGFKVDLYEAGTPGSGGSGNRQGALYIKLAVDTNPSSRFYLAGLEYSRRCLTDLDPNQQLWSPTGVLQLAMNEQEARRQQKFLKTQHLPDALIKAVNQAQASELAGSTTSSGGLFYPKAGWVKPKKLCEHLAGTLSNLTLYNHRAVTDLTPAKPGNEKAAWQLTTAKGSKNYQQVVICCATAAKHLSPCQWLTVKSIRGQVSYLPLEKAYLNHQSPPYTVVCGKGYALPPSNATLCFGATFDIEDSNLTLREADQQKNKQELAAVLPGLLAELPVTGPLDGRVGFRCASPDYLPLVGRLPAIEAWQKNYDPAQADFAVSDFPNDWAHAGLWLNLGHGSRGLASIPISAELLASQLTGEPAPFEKELVNYLNPARFILKKLRHQQNL